MASLGHDGCRVSNTAATTPSSQRQQRPDRGEDEGDELQFAHRAAAGSAGAALPPIESVSISPDVDGAGTVGTGPRHSALRPLRVRQRLAIGA
jgi:hypothetical protein